MRALPPVDYLRELFTVREDGALIRLAGGEVAGTRDKYVKVAIDGVQYKAHRIVWAIVHGADPGKWQVDHINGDKHDNRPANLRLCDNGQNNANLRGAKRTNKLGVRGVKRHPKSGRYIAQVGVRGKMVYLGSYATLEEAALAAEEGRRFHFKEFSGTPQIHPSPLQTTDSAGGTIPVGGSRKDVPRGSD